jgi:hypothetical protein
MGTANWGNQERDLRIYARIRAGESRTVVARELGISETRVRQVCTRAHYFMLHNTHTGQAFRDCDGRTLLELVPFLKEIAGVE